MWMCVSLQLKDLRMSLRSAGRTEEGAHLFTTLYRSWCHSLGAVLSLCFLSEASALMHLPLAFSFGLLCPPKGLPSD